MSIIVGIRSYRDLEQNEAEAVRKRYASQSLHASHYFRNASVRSSDEAAVAAAIAAATGLRNVFFAARVQLLLE